MNLQSPSPSLVNSYTDEGDHRVIETSEIVLNLAIMMDLPRHSGVYTRMSLPPGVGRICIKTVGIACEDNFCDSVFDHANINGLSVQLAWPL